MQEGKCAYGISQSGYPQGGMPLISVIVPTYNVQDYIRECLSSLLSQTYPNFEIIVCDDCSSDGTIAVLEEYSQAGKIRLLRNKKNMRQAAARNRCIRASQGQYIMMQDADDVAEPERMEKLFGAFRDGVDFVGSGSYLFDGGGVFQEWYGSREYPLAGDLLWRLPFVHASMMFRRGCLEAVGGYRDTKLTERAEDYDLIMRLYAAGYRGRNIKDLLYGYRVGKDAYARRTFVSRFNECAIRFLGFKENHILLPFGWIFVCKPFLAHAVQLVKIKQGKHYYKIPGIMR